MHKPLSEHGFRGRGQVAIENLLVFSLILMFLIAALVILWQIGAFKPFIQKRGWVGFSQIIPVDWVVAYNDSVYVKFKNEADVSLLMYAEGVNISVGLVECFLAPEETVILGPQDTVLVETVCAGPPAISGTYRLGDYYEADVVVHYMNTVSGAELDSVGKLYGHIEEPWSTFAGVTTTSLPRSTCNIYCPEPGSFSTVCETPNEDVPKCPYCNQDRRCVPKGKCHEYCESDKDCELSPDIGPNPCLWCNLSVAGPGGRCEEKEKRDTKCDYPCYHPRGFPEECKLGNCSYCYQQWSTFIGTYVSTCRENGSCGRSCDDQDFYTNCTDNCLYCNTTLEFGARCDQGDCGKHCTSDDPTVGQCTKGCNYCDVYDVSADGDPPSFSCEKGSCGEFCVDSSTCRLGCDVCYNRRCIRGDLAVTIIASNGSIDGKVVNISQTIYLNVSGTAVDGMNLLVVSEGVNISRRGPGCSSVEVNPSGKTVSSIRVGEITDPWVDAPLIPWRNDTYLCPGSKDCRHTWTTNESFESRFCYYAIGRESPTTGRGRWSKIADDYMDIGYLKVILVHPKPEIP